MPTSRVADSLPVPFDTRLQLFTGKGGVGKSTLVGAMAVRAVQRGLRPLVVELGHRASMHGVLGVEGIGFEPRDVGHGVWATSIDFESALVDYLASQVRLGPLARVIVGNQALQRFFHAAPGVGEVVTLSRIRALLEEGEAGAPRFDPVLVDLDATGHALMLLELPRVLDGLLGSGPLRKLLGHITALLEDPATTRLHLVTLPQELPVQETEELYHELSQGHRVPLGALLVNQIPEPMASAAELALARQEAAQSERRVVEQDLALIEAGVEQHARVTQQLRRLSAVVELPCVKLPDLGPARLGEAELARLGSCILGDERAEMGFEEVPVPSASWDRPVPSQATPWPTLAVDGTSEPRRTEGSLGETAEPSIAEVQARPVTRFEVERGAVSRLLATRKLIVCVGPGGVGKTTVAASLALRAARQGRRALVLTIDPARRLADALGLDGLDDSVHQVPLDQADASSGELWAAMLETRASFDALIARVSPNAESRQHIYDNPVYRAFSRTLARSHAYVAMERLYDEHQNYDLVVLDTPPLRSALEIIEAPGRLAQFLDSGVVRWLIDPPKGRLAALLPNPTAAAGRLLALVASQRLVSELQSFLDALIHLEAGFRERARAVQALLRSSETAFFLVAGPSPTSVADARFLCDGLGKRGVWLEAAVFNRAFIPEPRDLWQPIEPPTAKSSALARRLRRRLVDQNAAFEQTLEPLRARLPMGCFALQLPELPDTTADVESLVKLANLIGFENPHK